MFVDIVVFGIMVAGFVMLAVWTNCVVPRKLENYRAMAEASLRATRVPAEDERFNFDGADVDIMSREERLPWRSGNRNLFYECDFIARNRHGEYFFFLYQHHAPPYLKHTAHRIARVKLGARYLEPPVQ